MTNRGTSPQLNQNTASSAETNKGNYADITDEDNYGSVADVRNKRNRLLAETDYLALSDNTLTSDMNTYRQNLRDITNGVDTVDKCNAISWPTKP